MAKDETATSTGVGCIILLITVPLSYIVFGLVLVQLWQWFVVSWFALKPLTIPIGIGISLIVGLLTRNLKSQESPKTDTVLEAAVMSFMTAVGSPLFVLFIGWVVQMFISTGGK